MFKWQWQLALPLLAFVWSCGLGLCGLHRPACMDSLLIGCSAARLPLLLSLTQVGGSTVSAAVTEATGTSSARLR